MKYFTPIIKIHSQLTCNIYIKRDDLLPFSFGGNKVRIAEEFFADMRRKNMIVLSDMETQDQIFAELLPI